MLPFSVAKFNQFLIHRRPPPVRRGTSRRTLSQDLLSSGGSPLQPPNPQLLHCDSQQAKEKLIATLPNSKIELTRRNKSFNNFLIATKTAVHPLHNYLHPRGESARGRGSRITIHDSRVTTSLIAANSPSEWPGRTDRAKMDTRLLLLKTHGDTSGLQDSACSLFYLAGPK